MHFNSATDLRIVFVDGATGDILDTVDVTRDISISAVPAVAAAPAVSNDEGVFASASTDDVTAATAASRGAEPAA